MPTPHIAAEKDQIAPIALMPGDPLRAQYIAETYLENPLEINRIRGMLGFTGTYKGKPLTVMGSGMGMPSIGIYSYELYTRYDVKAIIRIGSAGGYLDTLNLFDVVLVTEAYSESTFARSQNGYAGSTVAPDAALNDSLRKSAAQLGYPLIEGRIHSSDVFYHADRDGEPYWQQVMRDQGCIGVEMESFALFHNARVTGKQAACILTISDLFAVEKRATAEEREKGFNRMMEIALGAM